MRQRGERPALIEALEEFHVLAATAKVGEMRQITLSTQSYAE